MRSTAKEKVNKKRFNPSLVILSLIETEAGWKRSYA